MCSGLPATPVAAIRDPFVTLAQMQFHNAHKDGSQYSRQQGASIHSKQFGHRGTSTSRFDNPHWGHQ